MDKPIVFYAVRPQVNRATGGTLYVPSIVEREEIVPLDEIVRRAIDRGLIVGIKDSAAKSIADAVARQMYEEFRQGQGVRFGNYFHARLYLDGTTDANGRLVAGRNNVNVRLIQGTAFKLTLDMFAFSNVAGGDIPGVDFVISDADGAERDLLLAGATLMLNGVNLYAEGDLGTKVQFLAIDPETGVPAPEPAAEITDFTSKGPNLLTFAWPAALEGGKSYRVVPLRSADGARWFTGQGHDVAVEAE